VQLAAGLDCCQRCCLADQNHQQQQRQRLQRNRLQQLVHCWMDLPLVPLPLLLLLLLLLLVLARPDVQLRQLLLCRLLLTPPPAAAAAVAAVLLLLLLQLLLLLPPPAMQEVVLLLLVLLLVLVPAADSHSSPVSCNHINQQYTTAPVNTSHCQHVPMPCRLNSFCKPQAAQP
jgi:hypothetical protein